MTNCGIEDCNEPAMARVSRIDGRPDGQPVQLIVRPPVDRLTGWLLCLHHAHVELDWLLMRAADIPRCYPQERAS
jgi:hypothetical protein